ncbi:MAG: VTT domain-containing protein [Nanoarchaeota archaeon]
MAEYEFITENSHWHKIITLTTLIALFLIILIISVFFANFFYSLIIGIPFTSQIISSIKDNITGATLKGLFYAHFIGGIFVIPSPDEVIFYYALIKGNPYLLSLLAAVAGYMLAQVINYFLGKKLSNIILQLVSKKKVYSSRRLANRYGAWGVFIFNLLPLPAPLLTFALGIAKYNFTRLFLLTLAGKVTKYLVLIGIHALTQR